MTRKPHAVQIAALNASNGARGFNYYMEQGLGKTATAYMDFLNQVAEKRATRMVVVCPNSFKGGWVDEAAEWGFEIDPFIYTAGDDWGQDRFLRKKFDKPPVLIINYESIRPKVVKVNNKKTLVPTAGLELIFKFMADRQTFVVFDESIQISTFDALSTDGAQMIAERALGGGGFVRNLSGKPMKQGPHDMWSQLRAIGHMNMNYFVFKNNFCKMGGFKAKQVVGAMNEEHLAGIIDPVTFRATKEDWTDLPPKVYMPVLEYDLTPEMLRHYKSMEEDFVVWLENEEYVTIDAALTKYIKLAQIQAGFIFDEDKRVRPLVDPAKNPRLALLETLLRDEIPGKAIVVYNHRPVRDMLALRFEKMRPVFIHGRMTDEEIANNKRIFNGDRDCRLICITKAAKYGHTLLGDQTDTEHACADMVFYENTYSLDDRSQLEDRAHRHGQAQEFMRYWDIAGTPLDRDAVKALQRKESVFQAVFSKLRRTKR